MNNNETNELELMRSQLAVMKKKLDEQQIVNDQLIRNAMRRKMSWVRKYVIGEVVITPFLILFFLALFPLFGFSLWLGLAWSALLLASVGSDWYINRTDPRDWLKENLTATTRKLLRMKTLRRRGELVAIPLAFALVAWMCCEAMQDGMSAMAQGFVVGGLLGGVVGGAIGFSVYRKMQRTNDELIREIEELTQD